MPRAETCTLDDRETAIKDAIALRDTAWKNAEPVPDFRCIECGEPVRPHKGSGYGKAHFEHGARNRLCPLSDPQR